MQKRSTSNFDPLAICHQLFNFVFDIVRRLKRMAFGHSTMTSCTYQEAQARAEHHQVPTKCYMDSQIKVQAKPLKGFENPNRIVDGLGSSRHASKGEIRDRDRAQRIKTRKRGRRSSSLSPPKDKEDHGQLPLVQEIGVFDGISLSLVQDEATKSSQPQCQKIEGVEEEPISNASLSRTRTQKWSAEEKGKRKKEEERLDEEWTWSAMEWENARMKAAAKPRTPLSFAYNINEKSDAFIRTRMEAMRKSL